MDMQQSKVLNAYRSRDVPKALCLLADNKRYQLPFTWIETHPVDEAGYMLSASVHGVKFTIYSLHTEDEERVGVVWELLPE